MTVATAHPSLQEFETTARADGYTEVLTREWLPLAVLDTHSHPFDARALVVRGELWLTVGTGADQHTRHIAAGQRFELARNTPHDERYGSDGATFWVARRSD
ncbi:MAG: AraC family transcriptional regulator [Pseudorhodobacter sp.]|nr:AraC family transcriptional regulator [Rhizobacter sp.]